MQGPELRHAAPENVLRLVGDSVRGRVQTESDERHTKLKLESSAKHFKGRWDSPVTENVATVSTVAANEGLVAHEPKQLAKRMVE